MLWNDPINLLSDSQAQLNKTKFHGTLIVCGPSKISQAEMVDQPNENLNKPQRLLPVLYKLCPITIQIFKISKLPLILFF